MLPFHWRKFLRKLLAGNKKLRGWIANERKMINYFFFFLFHYLFVYGSCQGQVNET